MKKFNQLFNKRMTLVKSAMAFVLVLFAMTGFGESFTEIGNGIAQAFDGGQSLTDILSSTVHFGGSAMASIPFLLDIKGNKFEIKSTSELEKMTDAEVEKYTTDLFEAQTKAMLKAQADLQKAGEDNADNLKQINELKDNQFKTMESIMKSQGLEIESLKMGNLQLPKGAASQIGEWLEKNHDEIKNIASKGSGVIELNIKAVGPLTTGSATNPDGIPELMGVQSAAPTNVNLKDSIVEALVTTIQTSLASYPYTETVPKDGDYAFVGEGLIKPQIDFAIETRYAEPKKVAAYEVLTTESVQDIPGLQSIANDFLRKKHALKKQNGLLFGTGVGVNPKGATVYGRTFVAGAMANKVANANIMDVINACITDVYTTHNYQDETPYMPNLAMMNPIDFFIEFVSAKDGNGLPLFPQAGLFNRVTIGGVTIIPFEDIPADKIFVADMSKYNTTNYVGYTVKIGWINDQLITNQFTMVGESRFHAFVKKLDEQAFIYDDISTIKAAILKP